jgi:hypothetical protein
MPVILATQERSGSKPSLVKQFARPYLEKPFTKIGLAEWLKVNVLSSRLLWLDSLLSSSSYHPVCKTED